MARNNAKRMRRALTRRPRSKGTAATGARREGRWSLPRFLLTLVALAWILRSFIVAPFSIPSGSMLPTLYVGDYLMVAKWPYGYSRYSFLFGFPSFDGRILERLPRRGDVIVFRHPGEPMDLIKRVIGLPGDVVEVRDGAVSLNGTAIPRERLAPFRMSISANSPCKMVPPAIRVINAGSCEYRAYRETLPGGPSYAVLDQVSGGDADDRPATRVPPGHVFLMGDNRDDSLDSRFPTVEGGIGVVPVDHLIGRALVTFWSTDGSASYFKPWTWFTALRAGRIGNGYTGGAA
ncbi:MAG TPA: signal peptidase I [Sphingomicrobium sp.]